MAKPDQLETPGEREARIAHERVMLDEARAAHKAGRSLSGDALDEWLAAFVGDGELPSPATLTVEMTAPRRR